MIIVILLNMMAGVLLENGGAPQEPPSVEEVIKGVEAWEQSVRNASVTIAIESERGPFPDLGSHEKTKSSWLVKTTFDRDGQIHWQGVRRYPFTDDDKKTTIVTDSHVAAYQHGKAVLIRYLDTPNPIAETGTGRHVIVGLDMDPDYIIYRTCGKMMSEYLKEVCVKVERQGSDLLCVGREYTPRGFTDCRHRQFYVVDPSRGFIVKKRVAEMSDKNGPWRVIGEVIWRETAEVQPSIWLPTYVEKVYYRAEGISDIRVLARFSDWKVNLDLPPDTFTVGVPNNTFVRDETTGKRYWSTKVDEKLLAKQAEEAKRLAEIVPDPTPIASSWFNMGKVMYGLGGIIVVVSLVYFARRMYRRSS